MIKVIIAGSEDEYVRCLKENNLRRDKVPYIRYPDQIDRIHESVEPIYFGTFYQNPALDEIERRMKAKGIKVKGQYVNLAKRGL